MSSFFSTPASQRKRKRAEGPTSVSKKRNTGSTSDRAPNSRRSTRDADESSISGDDVSAEDVSGSAVGSRVSSDQGSDSEAQTAAERRLRLAERYLDNVRADVAEDERLAAGGFDAEDVDRDLIASRLKEDVAEDKGRVYRYIADALDHPRARKSVFRANTLATTGVATCHPFVYTVSKDITLIKWKLIGPEWSQEFKDADRKGSQAPRRKKPKQMIYTKGNRKRAGDKEYQHHTAAIYCVAASADGKYVATGAADRRLIIWDAKTLKPLRVFPQHRDTVTGLAFRGNTNQLFSASKDRTIKTWSLNELAYVETLFGHQDEVTDVSAVGGSQERCVSVGARDRTARLWKVVEESQLVFRGGAASHLEPSKPKHAIEGVSPRQLKTLEGSLDRVVQIDTQLFVTGSDSGALSLFSLHKKKPLHVLSLAHGLDPAISPEQSSAESDPAKRQTVAQPTPRWITALACIPYSNLLVSGSWDGYVRLWKLSADLKKIESAGMLGSGEVATDEESVGRSIKGVVNDLGVFLRGDRGKDGVCVVAAVGSEPRNGRWLRSKGRNEAVVYEIPFRSPSAGAAMMSDGT